jgi:HlyD family secretion protein
MRPRSFVFIFACLGIASTLWVIQRGQTVPPKKPPAIPPAEKPYYNTVVASGLIESMGDNIAIGSPSDGIVQEVYVTAGQQVNKGDPLFTLDSRELTADLHIAKAKEGVAEAECKRVHDQLNLLRSVKNVRALSQTELLSKENEAYVASAFLDQMTREREKIEIILDRLTVRAPIDGMVLQNHVHVGEYLSSHTLDHPPILMGNTHRLQIRVDVDEHNASHLGDCKKAIAYPKNRSDYPIELTLFRIEPALVPKISLTGSSREKVDTRVLQLIYAFDPPQDISIYVGQQVDVFIKRDGAVP